TAAWARAGQTTVADAGDILKGAGRMPLASAEPEPVDPSAPAAPRDWRVLPDVLAVRAEPSDAAPELAQLFRNAQVEVTGPIANGWPPARVWNSPSGSAPRGPISPEPHPARDDR